MLKDVKELLHTSAYHPEEIERFLGMNSFLRFDHELGYTQIDYVFRDGMEDTLSVYTYEDEKVHRKLVNYADQPCRLNTYGNSFTQCAQVSDGETWQEILAAHFREPIRNFGFGGYGVYQAYRLAMRMESSSELAKTALAADHIILNIWGDDDHYRSLDEARWIRVGWMCRDLPRGGGEGTYPVHGFPWAHVRFDTGKGEWEEREGMCEKAEDLRKLAGKDAFYNAFKDDPVVHLYALREGGEAPVDELEKVAEAFGVQVDLRTSAVEKRMGEAQKLREAYGLRATMFIIDKLRAWADANNRNTMILLSYDVPPAQRYLKTGTRFDDELVQYLEDKGQPYVDTLKKLGEEYSQFKIPVDDFIARLYIGRAGAQVFGHHNPYGNFWFAYAIRKELVDWLTPKPPAYR